MIKTVNLEKVFKNGQEVMNLLSELNKEGATIVMVTYSQHAAAFASRIINLFDGQVITINGNKVNAIASTVSNTATAIVKQHDSFPDITRNMFHNMFLASDRIIFIPTLWAEHSR